MGIRSISHEMEPSIWCQIPNNVIDATPLHVLRTDDRRVALSPRSVMYVSVNWACFELQSSRGVDPDSCSLHRLKASKKFTLCWLTPRPTHQRGGQGIRLVVQSVDVGYRMTLRCFRSCSSRRPGRQMCWVRRVRSVGRPCLCPLS